MKLSELAVDRATVKFAPYEGAEEEVTVVFRPGHLTPEATDRLNQSAYGDDGPMLEWLFGAPAREADPDAKPPIEAQEAIPATVLEWDLEDDDGNPLPLTAEVGAKLPNRFLMRLVIAMNRGSAPDPGKSGT